MNVVVDYYSLACIAISAIFGFINDVAIKCHRYVIKSTWIGTINSCWHTIRKVRLAFWIRAAVVMVILGKWWKWPKKGRKRQRQTVDRKTKSFFRHPRSLNPQDRSNSAPNVNINNVKPIGDQRLLLPKGTLVRWHQWFRIVEKCS